jgi:hypothetical protein
MRNTIKSIAAFLILLGATSLRAAPLPGLPVFYGDPPDDHHPWAVHDRNRPQPPVVAPKISADPVKAPADAIILFDGTDASLAKWEADKPGSVPTKWIVKDGVFQCVPGSGMVRTKEKFGDCQLHVEWAAPSQVKGDSQGRGNSGIFLEGVMECQVLDNYNNPTYADGFACSVYGVQPPLANALRPPGQFQIIDIEFHRPVYEGDKCVKVGWVTVYCNGVLVQDHTQIEGFGGHQRRSVARAFPETGPLKLQDHGNPVSFRNIWIRPLPPSAENVATTGGPLSIEATIAKRKEIAADIRKDAATMSGLQQTLRFAESLIYEKDEATLKQVSDAFTKYVDDIKALPANQLAGKKDEVKGVDTALKYLTAKANVYPQDFGPKVEIAKLIKAQGWDKK